jgi:two-component system, OmpR family, phosphate regulon sensor histidine kinase PhoR
MSAIFRRRWQSQDKTWSVLALLVAIVIVPTACLLWFLNNAVRNERLAVRQKLIDAYRGQLTVVQEKLEKHWRQKSAESEARASNAPAQLVFSMLVSSGEVESVICFDPDDNPVYPTVGTQLPQASAEAVFAEAIRLEQVEGDAAKAADEFKRVAAESTDTNVVARALQGQARCLLKAGRKDEAVLILTEQLNAVRLAGATDAQGRLIVANAELLALDLMKADARFQRVADRLAKRVRDYESVVMPAPQRRFLMHQMQQLTPTTADFPTLRAEDLAAAWLEAEPKASRTTGMRPTEFTNICQFTSSHRRVTTLHRCDRLTRQLQSFIAGESLPADVQVSVVPPGHESPVDGLVTTPIGSTLPGWRLNMSLKQPGLFDSTANERISTYFWISFLAVNVMCILAIVVLRVVRQQVALTRLKNDLVANVTHELKTPLSSMRLLVDTLLNSDKFNEQTTREYLQLIATENNRLSRLIDNFLTFSRMERNKHVFEFEEISAARIIEGAAAAVRERFNTPGCRFEVDVPDRLPGVMADADALVTALINLLDNAYKYSGDEKRIAVRARAENGRVTLAVEDNGIGLSPREAKKVFKRFYQVDQRLSRETSGCGLGLSIVQYIVAAHKGDVRVESDPNKGSTFAISLPAAQSVAQHRS